MPEPVLCGHVSLRAQHVGDGAGLQVGHAQAVASHRDRRRQPRQPLLTVHAGERAAGPHQPGPHARPRPAPAVANTPRPRERPAGARARTARRKGGARRAGAALTPASWKGGSRCGRGTRPGRGRPRTGRPAAGARPAGKPRRATRDAVAREHARVARAVAAEGLARASGSRTRPPPGGRCTS